MYRKRKIIKNPIVFETDKHRQLTQEEKLEWLTGFWKKIGMNREPTLEDLIEKRSIEEETILMMRYCNA